MSKDKIEVAGFYEIDSDAIGETVYKPSEEKTCLAIRKGDSYETQTKIRLGENVFKPIDPEEPLLRKKVIMFASGLEDYESEEKLVSEIRQYIHDYVDISDFFEVIATHYVLMTWVYDRFNEVPYLRVMGDYGSGKSRFLKTVGRICFRPIFAGGATTTSPIFRLIDKVRGTLILDEADFRFSDKTSDIIKILNTGYEKDVPVLRSAGEGHFYTKTFDVFGPKIIATRDRFEDQALESRFIVEEMNKAALRDDIPYSVGNSFYDRSASLRNKLLRWRLDNLLHMSVDVSNPDLDVLPRLNQIMIPLLNVISSEKVRRQFKNHMREYNQQLIRRRELSDEWFTLKAVFEHLPEKEEVAVGEIKESFNRRMETENEEITARKMGSLLRNNLKLETTKRDSGRVVSWRKNKQKLEHLKDRYGIQIE